MSLIIHFNPTIVVWLGRAPVDFYKLSAGIIMGLGRHRSVQHTINDTVYPYLEVTAWQWGYFPACTARRCSKTASNWTVEWNCYDYKHSRNRPNENETVIWAQWMPGNRNTTTEKHRCIVQKRTNCALVEEVCSWKLFKSHNNTETLEKTNTCLERATHTFISNKFLFIDLYNVIFVFFYKVHRIQKRKFYAW